MERIPLSKLEPVLERILKPARYIGGEINTVDKEHGVAVLMALVYPDLYELGMANISLKIV